MQVTQPPSGCKAALRSAERPRPAGLLLESPQLHLASVMPTVLSTHRSCASFSSRCRTRCRGQPGKAGQRALKRQSHISRRSDQGCKTAISPIRATESCQQQKAIDGLDGQPSLGQTMPELQQNRSPKEAGKIGGLTDSLAVRMLNNPDLEGEPLKLLRSVDAFWSAMKELPGKRGPTSVRVRHRSMPTAPDFDVCICGGTLGIFLALALQMRGHKVCVVERNRLEGRTQEWNISRKEVQELVLLGLLNAAELENAIVTEFNPIRIGFKGSEDIWVRDVLNTGVSPRLLLETLKQRFLEQGGQLYEHTTFTSAEVYNNGVAAKVMSKGQSAASTSGSSSGNRAATSANGSRLPHQHSNGTASTSGRSAGENPKNPLEEVRARLVVDCMGHWSPIVRQIRGTRKPDGICLVVGGCATGFPPDANTSGDFLRTITHAENNMQLFFEAFPAEGGQARTTYMFSYMDVDRRRPSLQAMLDRYFELLPQYQGVPLSQLKFKRVLFAGLPCYADGPLRPHFDRILQIGDASASASPLSFGGFGSMVRHLGRLTAGVNDALCSNALSQKDLQLLQPYQPSLSAAWLFQRSMSLKVGQLREARGRCGAVSGSIPPDHVNRLLASNFRVMSFLGDSVLRPFLQDTIRWWPLTLAMNGMALTATATVARVVTQVGPKVLLDWFKHYWALAAYSCLYRLARPLRRFFKGFRFARLLDAWKFGAGLDAPVHEEHESPQAALRMAA